VSIRPTIRIDHEEYVLTVRRPQWKAIAVIRIVRPNHVIAMTLSIDDVQVSSVWR